MRSMRIAGSGLLAITLMTACAERNTPTEVTGSQDLQFSFANNPDNGNPRIVRFGDVFAFLLVDPRTDLFSVQASTNRQFGCNESPDLISIMEAQEIWHNTDDPAAGQLNQLVLGKGIYIAVFEGGRGGSRQGRTAAICSRGSSRMAPETSRTRTMTSLRTCASTRTPTHSVSPRRGT